MIKELSMTRYKVQRHPCLQIEQNFRSPTSTRELRSFVTTLRSMTLPYRSSRMGHLQIIGAETFAYSLGPQNPPVYSISEDFFPSKEGEGDSRKQ